MCSMYKNMYTDIFICFVRRISRCFINGLEIYYNHACNNNETTRIHIRYFANSTVTHTAMFFTDTADFNFQTKSSLQKFRN